MKNTIIYSQIGYYHPSQANWSYSVWTYCTINEKGEQIDSGNFKTTFGGEYRRKQIQEEKGFVCIQNYRTLQGKFTAKDIKNLEHF